MVGGPGAVMAWCALLRRRREKEAEVEDHRGETESGHGCPTQWVHLLVALLSRFRPSCGKVALLALQIYTLYYRLSKTLGFDLVACFYILDVAFWKSEAQCGE